MISIVSKIIIGIYLLIAIYCIIYILNTLSKANLYTTNGFIVFNSILFGTGILIIFFAIINTQLKLSNLK
jgi:hypothetical protein